MKLNARAFVPNAMPDRAVKARVEKKNLPAVSLHDPGGACAGFGSK